MDNYVQARRRMVEEQIAARGVRDPRVLAAMAAVPRHVFVPEGQWHHAHEDHPLPIGDGQTISQPYIVAVMTELLRLVPADKVLEIGTGSGYQAAILAELCDSVFSVEIVPALGERAGNLLTILGYKNVFVKVGDGYQGWARHAPYQAVIVTCSPTHIPLPLIGQLDEGGRMIIPVGRMYSQELIVLEKKKGLMTQKRVLPVRFVPMVNSEKQGY